MIEKDPSIKTKKLSGFKFLYRVERFLVFILFVGFILFEAYSSAKSLYSDFFTIRKGEIVTGIIKDVVKDSCIEIEYKDNGEIITRKFYTYGRKNISDYLADYFLPELRIGDKIQFVVGNNNNIILCSGAKSVIRDDVIVLVSSLVLIVVFLIIMFNKKWRIDYESENQDIRDTICTFLNGIAFICFFVGFFKFFIFGRDKLDILIFLAIGYGLLTLPSIFLKKEVSLKNGNSVSYDDEPNRFLYISAFHIIVFIIIFIAGVFQR